MKSEFHVEGKLFINNVEIIFDEKNGITSIDELCNEIKQCYKEYGEVKRS